MPNTVGSVFYETSICYPGCCFNPAIETALALCMAGRAFLLHSDPDGILVAVHAHLDDFLRVSAGLAFTPELLARPREKPCVTRVNAKAKRLCIHVSKHQNVARVHICYNGSHQAIAIEFRRQRTAFFKCQLGFRWCEGRFCRPHSCRDRSGFFLWHCYRRCRTLALKGGYNRTRRWLLGFWLFNFFITALLAFRHFYLPRTDNPGN
jgi:hypothetical protein